MPRVDPPRDPGLPAVRAVVRPSTSDLAQQRDPFRRVLSLSLDLTKGIPAWRGSESGRFSEPQGREALPPHLVADLGVGRDWVAAGNQGVGEADEAGLLLGIVRGLIRAAGRDLGEANVLRLPVWQGELELLPTSAPGRLR